MPRVERYECDLCGANTDKEDFINVFMGKQICPAGGPSETLYERMWLCKACLWYAFRKWVAAYRGGGTLNANDWDTIAASRATEGGTK